MKASPQVALILRMRTELWTSRCNRFSLTLRSTLRPCEPEGKRPWPSGGLSLLFLSTQRSFERARRILVPNLSDWSQTGKVLARLAAKYNYEQIGQGRLTNDALIAMTANARDFTRLAEFRS